MYLINGMIYEMGVMVNLTTACFKEVEGIYLIKIHQRCKNEALTKLR